MAPRDSRVEYERRMHRVLEYIDRHLDETLDLDVLADVALFSPYDSKTAVFDCEICIPVAPL